MQLTTSEYLNAILRAVQCPQAPSHRTPSAHPLLFERCPSAQPSECAMCVNPRSRLGVRIGTVLQLSPSRDGWMRRRRRRRRRDWTDRLQQYARSNSHKWPRNCHRVAPHRVVVLQRVVCQFSQTQPSFLRTEIQIPEKLAKTLFPNMLLTESIHSCYNIG